MNIEMILCALLRFKRKIIQSELDDDQWKQMKNETAKQIEFPENGMVWMSPLPFYNLSLPKNRLQCSRSSHMHRKLAITILRFPYVDAKKSPEPTPRYPSII